eukprot:5581697-Pleurochrysis_carterae.AAC.1
MVAPSAPAPAQVAAAAPAGDPPIAAADGTHGQPSWPLPPPEPSPRHGNAVEERRCGGNAIAALLGR